MILDIDKIDCDKKIRMYNDLKQRNVALMFYEDLRKFKDASYKNIKDNLFRVSDHKEMLNKEKTLLYGVPIYELETEKFYMLVSCRDKYCETDVVRRHCYSLICNINQNIYRSERFVYGYTNFDINNVLHVFEKDSYSSNGNGFSNSSFVTTRVNRIADIQEIVNSLKYNEIQIANRRLKAEKFGVMKPDYLVVLGEIEDRYVEEAKNLGIPIVKINGKADLRRKKEVLLNTLDYEKIRDDYTDGNYQESYRKVRRIQETTTIYKNVW